MRYFNAYFMIVQYGLIALKVTKTVYWSWMIIMSPTLAILFLSLVLAAAMAYLTPKAASADTVTPDGESDAS
jgi:hypothetical protein